MIYPYARHHPLELSRSVQNRCIFICAMIPSQTITTTYTCLDYSTINQYFQQLFYHPASLPRAAIRNKSYGLHLSLRLTRLSYLPACWMYLGVHEHVGYISQTLNDAVPQLRNTKQRVMTGTCRHMPCR